MMQWLMLQQDQPEDYVIATGEQHSVRDFVQRAAAELGIAMRFEGQGEAEVGVVTKVVRTAGELRARCKPGDVVVKVDPRYFRPTEVEPCSAIRPRPRPGSAGNPPPASKPWCARWWKATTPPPSATAWSSSPASRPTTTTSDRGGAR